LIGSAENKVAAFEAMSAEAGMPAPFAAIEAASPMLNPLLLTGFSNYRYQQTLIKGGFKDSKFMSSIRPGSRRAGLRSFRCWVVNTN
jgi:hypothetical protein